MPLSGDSLGRLLMIGGTVAFLAGALLATGVKIPLGRLPGDIVIRRDGGSFYFPIVTCLLLSGILSVISWVLRR